MGGIDAIVARALARDPAQCHTSVEALAADLRAHLDRLPVSACGSQRRYRASVFMRRHRVPLAAGALVLLALAGGLGVALWQARGRDLTAKALLDQGARRLEHELNDQPTVRAELHREIGRI